jgi:hypothetical protein
MTIILNLNNNNLVLKSNYYGIEVDKILNWDLVPFSMLLFSENKYKTKSSYVLKTSNNKLIFIKETNDN